MNFKFDSLQKFFLILFLSVLFVEKVFGQDLETSDTLELPFFDDFSYISEKPSEKFWKKSSVSVNTNIPDCPPSTGVLLFDALDSVGNFYSNSRYGSVTPADTIESLPINLDYVGDRTIWMSFYYQRGGLGDPPENSDSLVLEFYSPSEDKWCSVKSYEGGTCKPFAQEMINISEPKFLKKGFKFRFRNYISLGSSLAPDLVSNCDYWLIDYITIDKNRNNYDTIYNDVSLTNTPIIKVGDYQQVPWKHYQSGNSPSLNYIISYRNNDSKARLLDSINMYIDTELGEDKYALGSFNMPGYMDFENKNANFNYTFKSNYDTISVSEITVKLVSDATSNDYAPNNQLTVTKTFYDNYAYDDGTAEAAYGLHGEGSDGGCVAVKFNTFVPDLLNGIYMYFCPVFNDMQAENFNLKVWRCYNGVPSTEIYSKNNVAVPKDNTGKFVFIPFDELVEVKDTFFVGWEKNGTSIIAVGFDRNTKSPNNKFFNIGTGWRQSKEMGQIMIRPAFGDFKTPVSEIIDNSEKSTIISDFRIYPNPTKNSVTVDSHLLQPTQLLIINELGQQVLSTKIYEKSIIDLSGLKSGLYLIYVPSIGWKSRLLIVK